MLFCEDLQTLRIDNECVEKFLKLINESSNPTSREELLKRLKYVLVMVIQYSNLIDFSQKKIEANKSDSKVFENQ